LKFKVNSLRSLVETTVKSMKWQVPIQMMGAAFPQESISNRKEVRTKKTVLCMPEVGKDEKQGPSCE
jgi:hypothetical protein